jgi:hypothetical protein
MLRKTALTMGMLAMLAVPSLVSARDHDDDYRYGRGYYGDRHRDHEWRERERHREHEWREREEKRDRRYYNNNRNYNNGYGNGYHTPNYNSGYYDAYGYWHAYR